MVVYELICENNHKFEGWFPSYDSLKGQIKNDLLACAICGAVDVDIIPSGGHILKSAPVEDSRPKALEKPTVDKRDVNVDIITLIKSLNHYIKKNFDNVGDAFPKEARKIFHGEAEKRNIYGNSTLEEQEALREEGIPFSAIPELIDEFDN